MKRTTNVANKTTLTVVILESPRSLIYLCELDHTSNELISKTISEWDPSGYLGDIDGKRLLEEVIRQVRLAWGDTEPTSGVALTLPGTLAGHDTIVSSSRLGIRQQVPVAQILSGSLGVPCRAFHDVECLAIGEDRDRAKIDLSHIGEGKTLVYVFADEGIGSKTIIDGKTYWGAGAAGTLGRMTVQPDGSYFKELSARGPLEIFSSRPWVSENLVAMYLSERDKKEPISRELDNTRFRRALRVAAAGDWRGLDYAHIADGVAHHDPIVTSVLDVAARYLGFTINSVITILHPHHIVLGGAMMSRIPRFADEVIAYARRYSWPLAWNSTQVTVSKLGRQAQANGAVQLWLRNVNV